MGIFYLVDSDMLHLYLYMPMLRILNKFVYIVYDSEFITTFAC